MVDEEYLKLSSHIETSPLEIVFVSTSLHELLHPNQQGPIPKLFYPMLRDGNEFCFGLFLRFKPDEILV